MTTVAEVKLWGRTIGAVATDDDRPVARFEYDPAFSESGIEVSPLTMPLSRTIYSFPELPLATFRGLPGLLADSLPDRFGNALIDSWLASQGRKPESFNAVERLCYTGTRGLGALEFAPALGPRADRSARLQVDTLVELAAKILAERKGMRVSFSNKAESRAMQQILQVGTSAGGARAKAVIAWNPDTNEVRSGQVQAASGFSYWLIKFDGVQGVDDRDLSTPRGFGAIEYAYAQMARNAGITLAPCRLFEEGGRRHFMTLRFDRTAQGAKIHMQSLCALAHYDFNAAGAYSYEQAFLVLKQLRLPRADQEQQVRRMLFNVVARNQDDHAKNIAFLMDRTGRWSLSPAYDLTYSYNPLGAWTAQHQMSINGKRDDFSAKDLELCARVAGFKPSQTRKLLSEVCGAVAQWKKFANDAGVVAKTRDQIFKTLRLKLDQ